MLDITSMILTDVGYEVLPENNTKDKFVVFSKHITNDDEVQLWFYKRPTMSVTLYDAYIKNKKYSTMDDHVELDKIDLIACYNTCVYLEEATKGQTSFNESYKIFKKKEK